MKFKSRRVTMGFLRNWDSSCPHVWDSWEADGVKWVIKDLPPEDDDEAMKILLENLCTDEPLCAHSGVATDPESMISVDKFWRVYLKQRMSLGCYCEINGESKLVALNVCVVQCRGDKELVPIEGRAWKNVYGALAVCDKLVNQFDLLGLDMILYAVGLVVTREYRGAKLGARILAAREPLALHHCILGTSTVFTGPASQRSAERSGFSTALTLTWKDLAKNGLDYPEDETRSIKLMIKKFDCKVETL